MTGHWSNSDPFDLLKNVDLTNDTPAPEIVTPDDVAALRGPAGQLFSRIWGSVCISCHSDLVDAMCPRCTSLATINNALPFAEVDWDAVRADTARTRTANDIRLFEQFVSEATGRDDVVVHPNPLGAFGEAERIDDVCTGSAADLPAFLDFGPFDPEAEHDTTMVTEFTCRHCGRLYTPDDDATSDEIFCCQEHRADDQAAYDASTRLDPL